MIQRRKPLKRSQKPIRRRNPDRKPALWMETFPDQVKEPPAKPKAAKRKAPVKKVSTKRKRDASVYTRRKAEFFKAHPVCQFPGCKKPTSDLHHSRGRAGSLFLDERFWKALCRDHHNWVGENMDAAREMGLLCPKGKWNSPPTE